MCPCEVGIHRIEEEAGAGLKLQLDREANSHLGVIPADTYDFPYPCALLDVGCTRVCTARITLTEPAMLYTPPLNGENLVFDWGGECVMQSSPNLPR